MALGDVIRSWSANNITGLSFDGVNLWALEYFSKDVHLYSRSGNILYSFSIAALNSPRGICFDGKNLWITDREPRILYLFSTDGNIINSFNLGFKPYGVAFDGKSLWLTEKDAGNLVNLSVDGLEIRSFAGVVGIGGGGICFDGKNLWLKINNLLFACIDRQIGSRLVTFVPPQISPIAIAFDGKYLYISEIASDDIHQISLS